jgi:hypothetical protein
MLWPQSENFDVVHGQPRGQHVPTGSSRLFQLEPSYNFLVAAFPLDFLSVPAAQEDLYASLHAPFRAKIASAFWSFPGHSLAPWLTRHVTVT